MQNLSVDELVGKTFTEQGFMSTSTSNMVAEDFAGNMRMTIEASKGAQALDISSISQYTKEAEVLLGTGQEMLITSAEVNISVQGATNDIKKCFRYAEWKSQIFHSIFTYSLVALIDEIKPSVAFLLSSKLIFSQSSR